MTTTMSDRDRFTIDYKAHELTVHTNIDVHPETGRGDPKRSARSRRSRSPHAQEKCRARAPRAPRVPMVP